MFDKIMKEAKRFDVKKYMDACFLDMIPEGYVELEIPEIISRENLELCGYFEKNPDYIQCVLPIRDGELDTVMQNKRVHKENLDEEKMMFLSPAACLAIYPMLGGEKITKNMCISIKSSVFRNEKYFQPGIRHYRFTIREMVFVGEEDYVQAQLDSVCEKALEFARKITSSARIEEAVDCFYPSTLKLMLVKYQKAHKSKRELLIPVDQNDVACASFNYHDTGFSKKFGFDNSEKVVTGCVGFGFERLINAYEHYGCNFAGEL